MSCFWQVDLVRVSPKLWLRWLSHDLHMQMQMHLHMKEPMQCAHKHKPFASLDQVKFFRKAARFPLPSSGLSSLNYDPANTKAKTSQI